MSSLGLPTMPRLPKATKFWKKRSANISEYDPTFRVVYLGNVLTGWAKGKFLACSALKSFQIKLQRIFEMKQTLGFDSFKRTFKMCALFTALYFPIQLDTK